MIRLDSTVQAHIVSYASYWQCMYGFFAICKLQLPFLCSSLHPCLCAIPLDICAYLQSLFCYGSWGGKYAHYIHCAVILTKACSLDEMQRLKGTCKDFECISTSVKNWVGSP